MHTLLQRNGELYDLPGNAAHFSCFDGRTRAAADFRHLEWYNFGGSSMGRWLRLKCKSDICVRSPDRNGRGMLRPRPRNRSSKRHVYGRRNSPEQAGQVDRTGERHGRDRKTSHNLRYQYPHLHRGIRGRRTNNAQLAIDGQASCIMDGQNVTTNTAGLYVVASTTTSDDGECTVVAAPPFGSWIIGTMISNGPLSNGSTASVLVHPGYRSLAALTGLSNANGVTLATSIAPSGITTGDLVKWDTNKNAADASIVAANVLTLATPAIGTVLTGQGTQTPNAIATGTYGFPLASAGSGAQPSYQRQLITSIPSSDTISAAGTFATNLSVPGGVLAIGSVIEIRAHGVFTNSASTQNFALQVNAGGQSGICPASSSNLQPAVNTNGYWDAACFIQVTATGNPGSAISWGQFTMASSNGSAVLFRMFSNATATGDVNFITTSAENVSLQATTMTGTSMTLQSVYAKVTY